MATRSLRVEFLPADIATFEVAHTPEVHDVALPDGGEAVPQLLENPHVDFPGKWRLVDESAGTYRYARTAEVADTSGTSAI